MNDRKVGLWAGGFGLVACVLTVLEFPLWMISGAQPSLLDGDAYGQFVARTSQLYLHRTLLDMFIFIFLLVFLAGFRQIIVEKSKEKEWLATLFFGIGLVYVALTLVSDSLTGAVGLDAVGGTPDPVVLRALTEATFLMYGSVALILLGGLLLVGGCLILSTRALPGWTGWLALAVALMCLAFVPSMYFGTDTTQFYSASGFGPSLGATFPFLIWICAVSVVMIRNRPIPG